MPRGAHSAERDRRRGLRRQRAAQRAATRRTRRPSGRPAEADDRRTAPEPTAPEAAAVAPEQARRSPAAAGGQPRRGRLVLTVLLLLAVAGAAAALTALLVDRDGGPAVATRSGGPAAQGPAQETLLLVRHAGEGGPAEGMTLFAAGGEGEGAAVVLLPVGTLVDIPGVGLDRLGLAHQYGGPALAQATVENLLGIEIDQVAAVDDRGLGAMLGRAGGFEVTVPQRLVVRDDDGTARVRFEPGEQFLDGPRLAEYWAFTARGEDELASFSRQQQVLTGWLDQLRDPETFEAVTAGGLPQLDTSADEDWLRRLVSALADARAAEGLRITLLPVEAFGGEGPEGGSTYRPREEAIASLVAELLDGSVPADGTGGAIRVQVLNGVGVPGIGELVDRRLGGGSFRIVLTDNARDFDFTETRILVYDESSRSMEAAERVRERLGVGTIQVSRQLQSVVDLTIVVGADFLEDAPGAGPAPQEPDIDEE